MEGLPWTYERSRIANRCKRRITILSGAKLDARSAPVRARRMDVLVSWEVTCRDALQGCSSVARGQEPGATVLVSRKVTCRDALMSRAQDAQERPGSRERPRRVKAAVRRGVWDRV